MNTIESGRNFPHVALGTDQHFVPFNVEWDSFFIEDLLKSKSSLSGSEIAKAEVFFIPPFRGNNQRAEVVHSDLYVYNETNEWSIHAGTGRDGGVRINVGYGAEAKYDTQRRKYLELAALLTSYDSSTEARLDELRTKLLWEQPAGRAVYPDIADKNYKDAASLIEQNVLDSIRDDMIHQLVVASGFAADVSNLSQMEREKRRLSDKYEKIQNGAWSLSIFGGFGAALLTNNPGIGLAAGTVAIGTTMIGGSMIHSLSEGRVEKKIAKQAAKIEQDVHSTRFKKVDVDEWRGALSLTPKV